MFQFIHWQTGAQQNAPENLNPKKKQFSAFNLATYPIQAPIKAQQGKMSECESKEGNLSILIK